MLLAQIKLLKKSDDSTDSEADASKRDADASKRDDHKLSELLKASEAQTSVLQKQLNERLEDIENLKVSARRRVTVAERGSQLEVVRWRVAINGGGANRETAPPSCNSKRKTWRVTRNFGRRLVFSAKLPTHARRMFDATHVRRMLDACSTQALKTISSLPADFRAR